MTEVIGPAAADERTAGLSDVKRTLLERLRQRAARPADEAVRREPRDGVLLASYQQDGMFFLDRLNNESVVYQLVLPVGLSGPLDAERLRRALSSMVARHEALRTRFELVDGELRQVIDPAIEVKLPVIEVDEPGAQDVIARAAAQPLDLETGPLFQAGLLRLSETEHVLLLCIHHIVFDGWSYGIFCEELATLFAGPDEVLPEVSIQPVDAAAWQRRRLSGENLDRELAYWKERLAGLPTVDFPTDRPRPAQRTWAGETVTGTLSAELCERARRFATSGHVSFLATLSAALVVVLGRYTRQDDLAVGSVFSGRSRPELEQVVGYLANTVVLRFDASGDPSFRELAGRANDVVLGAAEHQDVPFSMVVDALRPPRDPAMTPLFQVSMSLQPGAVAAAALSLEGLQSTEFVAPSIRARFDLSITLAEQADGGLGVSVEYATEILDGERMHRLIEHLTTALEQGIGTPDRPVSQVELVSPAERNRLLHDYDGPVREVAATTLPRLFAEQVAARPDAVALVCDGALVTYADLDRRSNRIARTLLARGAGPGRFVGICLSRGPDLVAAVLGVLKAGAAFLILDPQHPPLRIAGIIADAAPVTVLVEPGTAAKIAADHHLAIDSIEGSADPVEFTAGPEDLAYVLYTSGSTGTPKGVLIEHRNVVAFIASVQELFELTPADRELGFASYTFDVSVFETFSALLTGARLVLARDDERTDPPRLQALLEAQEVTVTDLPPSVMALLDPDRLPALRIVFVGGEAFDGALVNRWNGGRRLFNGYGPTECTVTMIVQECAGHWDAPPPIGLPMANHVAHVVDATGRLVPTGVPGELVIGGAGLARGYLGQSELTASKFIADPFGTTPDGRLYHTGDLVKRLPDGAIMFLGRIDHQVKLRGLRIELGEIEHALRTHPGIRQACVGVVERDGYGPQLAAWIATETPNPGETELRAYLADRLPLHMIPASFTVLPELPLTSSGKVDRRALPDPVGRSGPGTAPRTATERKLAELWLDVLPDGGAGNPDIDESFFAAGGNSLHLMRLVAKVEQSFGTRLELRQLYTTNTIAGIATTIDGTGEPADTPWPVALNDAGAGSPVFLVHAVGGTVVPYLPIAAALDGVRAVHGIEAAGLDGKQEPLSDIGGMARAYVAMVRGTQPAGPYRVGGWSIGGVIAQEMAVQLTAEGEDVSLVLIDAPAPGTQREGDVLAGFVADVCALQGHNPPQDTEAPRDVNAVAARLEEAGLLPPGLRQHLADRVAVYSATVAAFREHQGRRFAGPTTLVTAEASGPEHARLWERLVDVDRHEVVSGDHYSIFEQAAALAAALRLSAVQTGRQS
ncbi:non-ribosomal peptide synthetase [Actinoplanes sp. TFC3]|uniref:non-ribosomal peptide synthetase n=1 Tax=Actinoplanes sp. TFC3 TaxID=1710355 RepID=UPI000832B327|nr:non-ribosomal peptide synthetase [Actinoplanes sp. TFC3]